MTKAFYKPAKERRYPGKQRDFTCDVDGCGMFPDAPMLHEEIWNSISHPRGMLCIKHTEERLGRPLLIDDLSDCPGNAMTFHLYDMLTMQRVRIPSLTEIALVDYTPEPSRFEILKDKP